MITPLQIEYPRRRQIFDESVSIIQKTNNPEVLFRRYDEVCDFIKWAFQMKKNGLPITIEKTEDDMKTEVPAFYNYHCVRVAGYILANKPDTKTLMRLQQSLKDAPNKEDSFIKIAQMINKTLIA